MKPIGNLGLKVNKIADKNTSNMQPNSNRIRAKKSLGQHFLRSKKALLQIVESASITKNDIVLEIGPGEGVLTEQLLALASKVIAIEKDSELIPMLQEKFHSYIYDGQLEIIENDALNFDPTILTFYKDLNYKLVANIPYYITGAIIEKYLSADKQPTSMVLLMQKEVAERIIARDGKESILSIAVKVYGKPKIVAKVPPGAFTPPPTVDSAILLIENINRYFFSDINEKLFFEVLKFIFGKKRKQIGGTLADFLNDKGFARDILYKTNIDPKTRPEDINLNKWKELISGIEKAKTDV